MNKYYVISLVIAITFYFIFYRLYKRIERRCCGKYVNGKGELQDCGSLKVKSAHFIFLPPEEDDLSFSIISPTTALPKKVTSWRHPMSTVRWYILSRVFKGVPRWFVRRAVKVTLRHHELKKYDHAWIEVVKIDRSPMSLWHAWWTKWFKREQYEPPRMEYKLAIYGFLRQLYHHEKPEKLDVNMTDAPELADAFIQDVFAILWQDEEER